MLLCLSSPFTVVDKKSASVDNKATMRKGILSRLLGSSTRSKILTWFFSHAEEQFYVRQLQTLLGSDLAIISRELRNLEGMGILQSERLGKEKIYSPNPNCPFLHELRGLVLKTDGFAGVLKDVIASHAEIKCAFIYGSFAKGTEARESDIDLFVIGSSELNLDSLHEAISAIENETRRTINVTYFPLDEYQERRGKKDQFILNVLAQPKIWLVGEENGL